MDTRKSIMASLGLGLALILSGCGAQQADLTSLQSIIATSLSAEIGTTSMPTVKCEQKLAIAKLETTKCILTDVSDLQYEVTVTVTDVDDKGIPTYDFVVAQSPITK